MNLLRMVLIADLTSQLTDPTTLMIGGGVLGGLLLALVVAFFFLRGGPKKEVDLEANLKENLGKYPLPMKKGRSRLSVQSQPSRVRLVVIAPVGRRDLSEHGEPEDLLNKVVRGLGDLAKQDKARFRTWPPQLSSSGFAPTFFRNTQRPKDRQQAPHWLLLAGQARAGDLPLLVGLALWCEEPNEQRELILEPHQWAEVLRIEK